MFHSSSGRSTRAGTGPDRPRWLRRWFPARPGGCDHVAFGTFCHGATALRDLGLRRWTGPFDWIFSTPGLIADCLDDDFEAFLDPRFLRSVPDRDLSAGAARQCHHLLFEERYGLPTLFNHHDPAGSASDLAALRRAVGRLRDAFAGGAPAALYCLSEVEWPEDELDRMAAALGRVAPGTRLAVITAAGGTTERDWSVAERSLAGRPALDVRISVLTRSLGTRFADPEDDSLLATVLKALARRLSRARDGHI